MASKNKGVALPFPGIPPRGNKPVSKIIFEKWAGSGSTFITRDQFRNLVIDYGYFLTDSELELSLKVLDQNGDGQIQYDEFLQWWNQENRFDKLKLDDTMLMVVNKASEVFRKIDNNTNGVIDAGEYKAFFDLMRESGLTEKDPDSLKMDLDKNGDGKISFNEYINYIIRSESIPMKTFLLDMPPEKKK
jgi:Ca2+-binding EF-hand superfamily protein